YLLYGPKSATGWGTPILLKGAQGAQGPAGPAGADGSTIFSGTSAPDISLGQNGDYYFNKSTGGLYGPKTVAGWGGPTSLVGPAGATGATGGTGATGATGTNGTNGVDGNKILNGTTAPSTALGNNGDYYLDKTSFNFYGPKTASGWGTPTLLRGAQGAQGPTGPAGADGSVIFSGTGAPAPALGNTGDYYFDKTSSLFYGPKTGSGWGTGTSLKGTNGSNGSNGSNGTNGANGTNGSAVLSGTGVPAAATGNDGDFYIDITTYKIYGPKAAGAWGSGTSLKGPAGNANVLAFETPDTYLFNWVYGGYDAVANSNSSYLRINRGGNDTTTYFNIPASALAAAKTGTIAVYLRNTGTTTTWQPVPFSIGNGDYVLAYNFKLTTLSASAFVRISVTYASNSSFINVDKVRIVIIPASTAGVLNVARPGMPLRQTMQKFNLADTDFKTLK
ncbi:MAG: hypothetical protein ABIN13_17890, partial [Mucilaginibacter sp.]